MNVIQRTRLATVGRSYIYERDWSEVLNPTWSLGYFVIKNNPLVISHHTMEDIWPNSMNFITGTPDIYFALFSSTWPFLPSIKSYQGGKIQSPATTSDNLTGTLDNHYTSPYVGSTSYHIGLTTCQLDPRENWPNRLEVSGWTSANGLRYGVWRQNWHHYDIERYLR